MSEPTLTEAQEVDDLLWRQLKSLPAFRALLRAVEARFYYQLPMTEPVMDLGCGDGHFATMINDQPFTAGFDPWWGPLRKSLRGNVYRTLAQALGDRMPYPDDHFATVFSNSVLEHIPDLQPVLDETNRVMQAGGLFIITTPSHFFTQNLAGARFLERLGLTGLAGRYRHFFNFISRHEHTDSPRVWAARLARAGFTIERWQYYYSKEALRAHEWGHVQGLPAAILHFLLGWWIIAPWKSSLAGTDRWLRPFYNEPPPAEGAYMLLLARKTGRPNPDIAELQVALPAPRPFSIPELQAREPLFHGDERITFDEPLPAAPAPANDGPSEPAATLVNVAESLADGAESGQAAVPALNLSPYLNGGLLLLAALSALLGQAILNSHPPSPNSGLSWYGLSLASLAFLGLRLRGTRFPELDLPGFRDIPWQRWLILAGFLFSIIAYRFANAPGGVPRVSLAFISWFLAIGVAFYALWPVPALAPPRAPPVDRDNFRWDWLLALGLFLVAFSVRFLQLTSLPAFINGDEANIGLDALRVVSGQPVSPFATGWLTNPTLPLYFVALPLRLFGNTAFALRIWSPLIGALTVVALFLYGKWLWNRPVGLSAAILLLGSHFHLHYSRLGITNIWDPFLLLLTFGTLALAWRDGEEKPWLWPLAGFFAGLSMYWYTSSHLLPLLLAGVLLSYLVWGRRALWARRRGLLAATLLALVVAWPQLLHYNSNPTAFMERANILGIFSSGWLRTEAINSGSSELAILWAQLKTAFLAFNYSLDQSTVYNPGTPLLRFWPALLFMVGLGLALAQSRALAYRLLVLWVGATMIFGAALLQGNPSSQRLLVAAPALALLAALPLNLFVERVLAPLLPNENYKLGLLTLMVLVMAGLDISYYYGTYAAEPRFGDRNTEIAYEMASYMTTLEGDNTVYFFGAPTMFASFPTISFLADEYELGQNLFDVERTLDVLPPPTTGQLVFIFLPERYGELTDVSQRYPGGTSQEFPGRFANPLYYTYQVSP
ncbi:MAG: glycosyltransferase family 39 protein [Ardenticatenales bacterium]|nr:glycosyltransferase family 39 protein [Ardenticatenales bacterium]